MEKFELQDEQLNLFEAFDELQDLDYSTEDVDVTFEFENGFQEISLEEFESMQQGAPLIGEDFQSGYARDWMLWEETTPLTSPTESDMLKKEIAELTESLYAQFKRVAELTDEVNSLKQKLEQVTNIHSNTRTY